MKSFHGHSPRTIFIITYLAMTFRRSALEIWSLSKSQIEHDLNFSALILGTFDTAYLISYALGEYINGYLCDRIGESRIISIGLLFAGLCLITMSILSFIPFANVLIFTILWLIEGYSHSAVLPGGVSLVTSSYPSSVRGKVMGLWGSAASFGNLFGIFLYISLDEELRLPWTETLAISGFLIITVSFTIMCLFRKKADSEVLIEKKNIIKHGFFSVFKVEGIIVYTIAYSCCKFMNYAWMMWLPYYLERVLNVDSFFIGLGAAGYEVGSMVGVYGGGWVSDKIGSRPQTAQIMLSFVVPLSLVLWNLNSSNPILIVFICFGLGICVAGICYLINSCAAADLSSTGQQIGAISGLMDGIASLFTGFGIFFIGFIQKYSWAYVFVAIGIADFSAIFTMQFIKHRNPHKI